MNEHSHILCVPGSTEELVKIRAFIESSAMSFGFPESVVYGIVLAVDEACSNVIRHGYNHDSSQELCVRTYVQDDVFTIEISDSSSIAFNPLDVDTPDLQQYIDKPRRGGLGVHLIRKMMDKVEYIPSHHSNQRNVLRLMKALR